MRLRDLLYLAKRELREVIVARYARPLRERVAELERDAHQLHIALAHDVTTANAVINVARAVSGCKDNADKSGPCGRCLEMLDAVVKELDGKDKEAFGESAKGRCHG